MNPNGSGSIDEPSPQKWDLLLSPGRNWTSAYAGGNPLYAIKEEDAQTTSNELNVYKFSFDVNGNAPPLVVSPISDDDDEPMTRITDENAAPLHSLITPLKARPRNRLFTNTQPERTSQGSYNSTRSPLQDITPPLPKKKSAAAPIERTLIYSSTKKKEGQTALKSLR
eukprot:TRINITY_DN1090_c0_g1_i4.p2 TRINITY_DN1090_c0_g1~~TRINITY_DN1090_c0_g1_i4.p2  ORF type:complete len:168 (-),score=32.20 TRINITY_DN1090_c0_g1_i4:518-1021(-)